MLEIKRILEFQKEVQYLTYLVMVDREDVISMELSTVGVTKKYKFSSENDCLNKLIDILFELKKLETWMLTRLK